VNVRFDSDVTGGVTEVSGIANGNKSADNLTGQNIKVTFNPNAAGDAGLVAHEGSHVGDASAWIASGFSAKLNPTNFTTEFNAYHVQFNIYNVQFNIYNALGTLQAPGLPPKSAGSIIRNSHAVSPVLVGQRRAA
jgi:hypothetical protein